MTSEGLTVSVQGADEYAVVDSFDDLDLQEGLLRGIYSYGFERPSAIQQRGIRPVLEGRDTIGQAQSGTGKTATFVIGALQRIDYGNHQAQALILAPTRELAQQIHKVVLACRIVDLVAENGLVVVLSLCLQLLLVLEAEQLLLLQLVLWLLRLPVDHRDAAEAQVVGFDCLDRKSVV